MARRGRPKGGDSSETRRRIINAARGEFARRGYDGASVATIAQRADLAPSAVYHYFGGKGVLYEQVFDATLDATWADINVAATHGATVAESVESVVRHAMTMTSEQRRYSDFLALVPMETRLHPDFAHMLDRRSKLQDAVFGGLAELGLRTGELDGFDLEAGTELIRSLLMGWFLETYFGGGGESPRRGESIITLFKILGQ